MLLGVFFILYQFKVRIKPNYKTSLLKWFCIVTRSLRDQTTVRNQHHCVNFTFLQLFSKHLSNDATILNRNFVKSDFPNIICFLLHLPERGSRTLHPACRVDSVSKQTISGHAQSDHSRHTWTYFSNTNLN